MTTLVQNLAPAAVSTAQHPQPTPAKTNACDVTLRQHATPVRARRRQRLALEHAPSEAVYIVRSGLLAVETAAPGKHRQLLALFYPGDIVRRALLPDLPGLTLSAMNVAEVWRLPPRGFEAMLIASAEHNTQAQLRLAEQHARATLHGSIVGALSGEERYASLLIELGLRLGQAGPAGVSLESPLTRTDIADYLALNADTLSRITSRFKARGLLLHARSGHTVLPNWAALCAMSPVADTLLALHTPRTA
jgi:CRP/FNR family transcriptional regulator, anaerobic regulatory protein